MNTNIKRMMLVGLMAFGICSATPPVQTGEPFDAKGVSAVDMTWYSIITLQACKLTKSVVDTVQPVVSSAWEAFKQKMTFLYSFLRGDTERRAYDSVDNDDQGREISDKSTDVSSVVNPPPYDLLAHAGLSAPQIDQTLYSPSAPPIAQDAQVEREFSGYPEVSNWPQHPDAHAPLYPQLNGLHDFQEGGIYAYTPSVPKLECITCECSDQEVVQIGANYFCNTCADKALQAQEQQ